MNLKYLLNQLNSANIKKDNPALHDTIQQLIQFNQQVQVVLQTQLDDLKKKLNGTNPNNKPGGLSGASYLTKNDETATLVNSIQVNAGIGVDFVDGAHSRTIEVLHPFLFL